jgi:peroxidase
LSRRCRWDTEYVDLDGTTPTTFDAQYYKNLEEKKGLLQTDQMLYSDARTSPLVSAFADQPWLFHHQFGASMVKLANIQVLTDQDEDGEIRTICSSINSNNY